MKRIVLSLLCSSSIFCIFCQSASETSTDTFNLVGASFNTLSRWSLMVSTLLLAMVTAAF